MDRAKERAQSRYMYSDIRNGRKTAENRLSVKDILNQIKGFFGKPAKQAFALFT